MEFQKGFTLIELIIVMTLIAIAGAVAVPRIRLGLQDHFARSFGQEVIVHLRQTQREAMRKGQTLMVRIDEEKGTIVYGDGEEIYTPEELRLKANHPVFMFFPDGTAMEGKVAILSKNGTELKINVDPFSGLARYEKRGG